MSGGSNPSPSATLCTSSQMARQELANLSYISSNLIWCSIYGGSGQMVKAQDCESWDCGFESRLSPHRFSLYRLNRTEAGAFGVCHGRRRTVRLAYPRRPPFYGRGIVVVQQSPKLPYGSSILSVRASFKSCQSSTTLLRTLLFSAFPVVISTNW